MMRRPALDEVTLAVDSRHTLKSLGAVKPHVKVYERYSKIVPPRLMSHTRI